MKKFILSLVIAFVAVISVNAQKAVQTSKFFDNTYVGATVGATTPLSFDHFFPVNPTFGLKVGKNLTPIFGLNIEGTTWFGSNTTTILGSHFDASDGHNAFRAVNVGLNGTVNLTNAFLGYNADKVFEVYTQTGLGWLHTFNANFDDANDLTANTGVVFAWNVGSNKAWQLTLNPTVYWNLTRENFYSNNRVKFDKNHAQLGLNVGVNYKFKTSNGTHNFKVWDISALNDEINSLRSDLAKKPTEVMKEVVKTVTQAVTTEHNPYIVSFAQGKYALTDAAKSVLNAIDTNSTVVIDGTASPEGTKSFNNTLSQKRAEAVAEYLKGRGVNVQSVNGLGSTGDDSQRIVRIVLK